MNVAPLSVVIAAHNAAETLDDQLGALTRQDWPAGGEIIVADNGSTDATAEIALARGKRSGAGRADRVNLRVVDASQRRGAGHARNVGVEHAEHQIIAFCDADDIVADRWVSEILQALATSRAVGGRLDFEALNPSWVVGSRGRLLASEQLPLFDGVFPVLSSCNLGIHRDTFERLGGFDTSFVRGQDAELSMRLHERQITASFAEKAVVHYRMRGSAREIFQQARGWGEAQVAIRTVMANPSLSPTLSSTARSWAWLASRAPTLVSRSGRARWAHVAGTRIGTATARRAGATSNTALAAT